MTAHVYTMQQLEERSGVQARTVRQWIRLRLLPKPLGKGRAARYDHRHLLRVQAVQALRAKRVNLKEIGYRVANMDDAQLAALVPVKPPPTDAIGVPLPPESPSYPSYTVELVRLTESISLMIRTDMGPLPRRIAADIFKHYGLPQ